MVSKYDLLFEQWKANLAGRDRSIRAVQANFEELFETLKAEGLVLESAYEYIAKAVKAHAPPAGVVKALFKKMRMNSKFQFSTEKEFEDNWIKGIAEKANAAFFNVFPIQTKKSEEETEPKIFGSMTEKEYKMQREHADSYPRVDIEALEKQRAKAFYSPLEDMENLLGTVDSGDSK